MTSPTYHIVSHTHWDREWYRTFEQFRSMLVRMIDELLDLLETREDFACFTLDGQTVVLEDYLAVKPENAERIRRLVQQGRLLIGPWYVLPDEFLVSGEALLRNLLMGRAVASGFGKVMNVGYIPDSFGHIAMMPSLVQGFGMDAALVYRGFGGEPGEEKSEYLWIAPDGARCLLVHLYRNGYSAGYFHQESKEQILRRFRELKEELDSRATTSQRLLLNGGDHHWADPLLPDTLAFLRERFEGKYLHSTIPAYVQSVQAEKPSLPELRGELRFGYRYAFVVLGGIYSSRIYLKQRNWQLQNLLQRYAEPLAALAAYTGGPSQRASVKHAWRLLLQNHPHDSICGCSTDPVHREMMTRFSSAEDVGQAVVETSLERLVPYDDESYRDDQELVFFNPSPFARSEVAEAEVRFYLQDVVVGLNPDVRVGKKLPATAGFVLVDEEGKEVPYQVIDRTEGYDITYSHYNYPKQTRAEHFRILVLLEEVPPVGFKRIFVRRARKFPGYDGLLRSGSRFLENEFLRVEAGSRGEITILDKTTKEKYTGLHCFEDSGDVGDEYNYSYPRKDRWIFSTGAKARVRRIGRGPVRAALEVSLIMEIPEAAAPDRHSRTRETVAVPVTTRISLTPGARSVQFKTTVDNRARDHRFRVLFPTGVRGAAATVDSQFTIVERERKTYDLKKFTIEHPAAVAPMQRFVAVAGRTRGLALLANGLPEYELKADGTLALTLLRCVGLLAAEDLITRPGGKSGWHQETPEAQCQGVHIFRYAITPMSRDALTEGALINREAERFHLPLLPVRRKNELASPLLASFLRLSGSGVILSAMKEAEDGDGIIVRLNNPGPQKTQASVHVAGEIDRAFLARLDETTVQPMTPSDAHTLVVEMGPSALLTLRLRFKTGANRKE